MLPLERCGHGEAEGLSWFHKLVVGAQGRACQLIRVVSGSVVLSEREHAGGDLYGRVCSAVEAEGVVGVVNAERRVDDRKHRLQFDPGGHTHNPIGARNRLEVLRGEGKAVGAKRLPALTGVSRGCIQYRTAELSAYQV